MYLRTPLRYARAFGRAERTICVPLPSTYPFSAQARLGPCWDNFNTVHLTNFGTMMINKNISIFCAAPPGSLRILTISHRLRGGLSNCAPDGA